MHHQIAETISDRRPLLQCARVVTWLEALFCKSQEYRAEQEQGTAALKNVFKQMPGAHVHQRVPQVSSCCLLQAAYTLLATSPC